MFIHITDGKVHDVNVLDVLPPEPGAYFVMDRGYLDFARLYEWHRGLSYFVIRAKRNVQCRRRYSRQVDKTTGVRSDQPVVLTGSTNALRYPEPLRRISYYAADRDKRFVFLTNTFVIPAHTVAALYHSRWQVEFFFKWVKQHLRIKRFFGTSENSVKTQIWIAVAVYVLIAIIKKRLDSNHRLYTILQIFSVSLFEKPPILRLLHELDDTSDMDPLANQLKLFDF